MTAFGKQAEILAKHARRGSRLHVQGQLSLSAWRDREDRAQYSADLLLQDFQFVGGAAADDTDGAGNQTARGEYRVETEVASDVQEIAQSAGAY